MEIVEYPPKLNWKQLVERPIIDDTFICASVQKIFDAVKLKGDHAIREYTLKFDKIDLDKFEVSKKLIQQSEKYIDKKLKNAIDVAYKNIFLFHKAYVEQSKKIETTRGLKCWRELRPIQKVGIYIPGGTAPLFSSVLMLGIPAKIAGCEEIILCTPPQKDGEVHSAILYAAKKVGIKKIFSIGGVQAIAAMTFGTETIPKVHKIFGPGNQYVTAAKQYALNFGVAIDMPAGPSELLIIADESASPEFVAADLLSQAEHGVDSQVILLTTSKKFAHIVKLEIEKQKEVLPRKEIVEKSLKHSKIVVLKNIKDCIDFSNAYAPEHLILNFKDCKKYIKKIINAGSVFIGKWSCESLGDYVSGPNHTLPTNGYSKNYSGVSVDSFVKKITFQEVSANALIEIGKHVSVMAENERLEAHKNAVEIRLKDLLNKKK